MLDKSLIENLERVDPDRYRASLFAPKPDRDALQVIYAFHAELAKVPEVVSEPMIGAIRYQWWRDVIDEIYTGKTVRQHEIVTPLAEVIQSRHVPRFFIDKLIDGRERDIDPTPFENIEEAADYAHKTSGQLMLLAASVISKDFDATTIAKLGSAWGLTGIARSWRYYSGGMLSKLTFREVMDRASALRTEATGAKTPARIMPAIAYSALIPGFMKRMDNSAYDPKEHAPHYSRLSKQARLMIAVLRGKI